MTLDNGKTTIAPLVIPSAWRSERTRPTRGSWAAWAALLVVLFAIISLIPRILSAIRGRPVTYHAERLVTVVPLLLALILVAAGTIFLHEIGHAIGGLIGGWQFQSIFLGPWRLTRDGERLRLHWHRLYLLYGGAVLVLPERRQSPARERRGRLLYIAGGPVMSLLFGAAVLAVMSVSGVPMRHVFDSSRTLIPFTAGLISFGLGVGTLIPQPLGGALRSDGLQLLLLLRSPKEGGVDSATRRAMIHLQLYRTRPREWDDELLELLPTLPESERLTFEYHRALDRGDVSTARDLLQRALEVVASSVAPDSQGQRTWLALEAATFEAAWRGNAAAARAWRERAGRAAGLGHGANVAAAALARAEGNAESAAAALRAAERDLRLRTFVREDLLRAATLERLAG
jgi:hypothetical protein